VMLVNLKQAPEAHRDRRRRSRLGAVLALAVLAEFAAIALYGYAQPAGQAAGAAATSLLNVERVGWLLYTDYLVPFELASMLLLVAMIGAIVLARKEL